MGSRLGEKAGWIGGWAGAFIWILILSVVWLVQGKTPEGLAGLALVTLGVVLIIATAPWRHPKTPFWKLMLPAYIVLGLSVAWAVWSFGTKDSGLNWWSMLWALPILIPFGTMGRRRWSDADPQQTDAASREKN
jgi:multisubunit Na+/H+ antiporter MnhB subunit